MKRSRALGEPSSGLLSRALAFTSSTVVVANEVGQYVFGLDISCDFGSDYRWF